MKKEDQEIARLRNLCETLFNDPLRSLCIVDSDGDIVMQNKSFTESFSSSESQTKLSEVLSKLLPLSELKRFDYALNTFFIPINDDNRAKFSIIEEVRQTLLSGWVFSNGRRRY